MNDLFDAYLQLPSEELEWLLEATEHFAPAELDFLINPRRLRGSDFLMRWAQGRWSEEVVLRSLSR